MNARLVSFAIFFMIPLITMEFIFLSLSWASTSKEAHRLWELSKLKGKDLVSNETLSLQVKRGSPTVVVFLSAKCPCSNSHVELLNQLKREFPTFGFIGVQSNQNENLDLSREYFNKNRFSFAVIRDEGAQIADALGALKTPHVFVFDGKDFLKYQGGISNSSDAGKATQIYLRKALSSLRNGENPEPAEVQALGCYISR